MVTFNNNLGPDGKGRKLPVKEHYQAIVETLNTLLDLGVIKLPDLSSQWQGHINAALNGEVWPLRNAVERWVKSIDPLLDIKAQNPVLNKWKQSEYEYIFSVHKILNFYLLVTTLAHEE